MTQEGYVVISDIVKNIVLMYIQYSVLFFYSEIGQKIKEYHYTHHNNISANFQTLKQQPVALIKKEISTHMKFMQFYFNMYYT